MHSPASQSLPRRRFLQIALGAAGLSVAAACSRAAPTASPAATAGANAGAAAPASGSTQGSLRIALFGSREDADRRAALIPPFNKLFPNDQVVYTTKHGNYRAEL